MREHQGELCSAGAAKLGDRDEVVFEKLRNHVTKRFEQLSAESQQDGLGQG